MKFTNLLVTLIVFIQLVCYQATMAQTKQFMALLVTTTKGWHRESVHSGVLALQQLGVKNHFDVVLFENPEGFTDQYLEQFRVVNFLNTTGDILDAEECFTFIR